MTNTPLAFDSVPGTHSVPLFPALIATGHACALAARLFFTGYAHRARILCPVICMIFICFHATSPAAQEPPLRYITEETVPDNYTENGVLKGVSVEVLHEIWKIMGEAKRPIEVLPWTQAFREAQKTPNTVIFTMIRNSEREALFKWAGPVRTSRFVLVADRKAGIRITSPQQLHNYRIGTAVDDINETYLVKLGIPLTKLDRAASSTQNLEKFKNGRFDLLPYPETGIVTALKSQGMNPRNYQVVFTLAENKLYFAFHKDTPDSTVLKFQQALDAIRKNGTLNKILKKYNVGSVMK